MKQRCLGIWTALTRRKTVDIKKLTENKSYRKLNLIDLLGLGVGNSLGIGVFAILPFVVRNEAGPSTVLSVVIAALTAVLSGLCYSELTCRLPSAGSSYTFTYAILGELCALIVGWNIIFEHVVGVAISAKAWSHYLDHLMNGTIHRFFEVEFQCSRGDVIDCPDILSLAPIVFAAVILSINVKLTTALMFAFTTISVFVSFCIICVGFFHVKHENWAEPPGFFPFGFHGTLSGSSILFYVFVNAELLATTAEETKNPTKIIPTGICTSLIVSAILIFCVALSLTLSFSWNLLPGYVAIPVAFDHKGIEGANILITVGGIIGLTVACLSAMFSIPRILFTISSDKLFFSLFKFKSKATGTPIFSILFAWILPSVLVLLFNLKFLIQMMSVSTLLSSAFVAVCVICLRYQHYQIGLYEAYEEMGINQTVRCTEFVYASFLKDPMYENDQIYTQQQKARYAHSYGSTQHERSYNNIPQECTYRKMDSLVNDTPNGSASSLFPLPANHLSDPTNASWIKVNSALVVYIISCVALSLLIDFDGCCVSEPSWWRLSLMFLTGLLLIISVIVIVRQPKSRTTLIFSTPYVPVVPFIVLTFDIMMLSALPIQGWIRLAIGLGFVLVVYLVYGVGHSAEGSREDQEVFLYEINDS